MVWKWKWKRLGRFRQQRRICKCYSPPSQTNQCCDRKFFYVSQRSITEKPGSTHSRDFTYTEARCSFNLEWKLWKPFLLKRRNTRIYHTFNEPCAFNGISFANLSELQHSDLRIAFAINTYEHESIS
jgi:hypothetical protein